MKKYIGFMCLALIATPACMTGTIDNLLPITREVEEDTSETDQETTEVDTGDVDHSGSCSDMTSNPDTCDLYMGTEYTVQSAQIGCEGPAIGGTYSATAACDTTDAFGYCELPGDGEGFEYRRYYYPTTHTALMAEIECTGPLTGGTWTSLTESNDMYIASCNEPVDPLGLERALNTGEEVLTAPPPGKNAPQFEVPTISQSLAPS